MTPVEVFTGTILFGFCVFVVALLANYRLGKLQKISTGSDLGEMDVLGEAARVRRIYQDMVERAENRRVSEARLEDDVQNLLKESKRLSEKAKGKS